MAMTIEAFAINTAQTRLFTRIVFISIYKLSLDIRGGALFLFRTRYLSFCFSFCPSLLPIVTPETPPWKMPLKTHDHDRTSLIDRAATITSKSLIRQDLSEVALPQHTFQIFQLLGFEDL
jgi:hypothetical protein